MRRYHYLRSLLVYIICFTIFQCLQWNEFRHIKFYLDKFGHIKFLCVQMIFLLKCKHCYILTDRGWRKKKKC
ncbi:hypothetical protein C2G38_2111501 [Gigaspora rosea]|uniref:Uncharacterized protein n=1 Tax=Gigaspora rosea TaxID=44941 RepID=A0A397UGE0_9GLOM|nr:hypothetical protein C2G38_2111501 [Gigaspora rosea]